MQHRRSPPRYAFVGGVLGAAFAWAMLKLHVQQTPEVRPDAPGEFLRIPFHLSLIVGLLAITATDLREFYISTRITLAGTVLALMAAAVSGDLQMCHIWVDWNEAIPQIRGPYLPSWLSAHPHLHGLAWSAAGLGVGVLLSAGVRWLGNFVLARPTLGSGDVYLMAMIGAYLGWQPTVVAFLLAPVGALLVGGVARVVFNRPALPYGPFLALGALIVLFGWRWIWMFELALARATAADDRVATFAVRRFFGDPVALALVTGIAVGGLTLLLGLLRLYQMIPVKKST